MTASPDYVAELISDIFRFKENGEYHQMSIALDALVEIVTRAIYFRQTKEIRALYDAVEAAYSRIVVAQPLLDHEETYLEKFSGKDPLEIEVRALLRVLDLAVGFISPEKVAEVANRPHNRALLHEIRDSVNGLSLTPALVERTGLSREDFQKCLDALEPIGLIECGRVGKTWVAYLTPLGQTHVAQKAA